MHTTMAVLHKSPSPMVPRLLRAGAYAAPRGRDYPPHRHNCWELLYYRQGRIDLLIEGVPHRTEPGLLLSTPPGHTHAERAHTAYANYCILVDAPADTPWPTVCHDGPDLGLLRICSSIVAEAAHHNPDSQAMLDLLVRQLDLHLRRQAHSAPGARSPAQIVRSAEVLFEERLAFPVTVAEVAQKIGVSPSTLRVHFTAVRGQSPQAYLLQRRVESARALLKTSNLTLDAVAEHCGFHSASHLSRHYKAHYKHSPGQQRGK